MSNNRKLRQREPSVEVAQHGPGSQHCSLHDDEFNPPGGPLKLKQVLDGHLCEGVRAVHLVCGGKEVNKIMHSRVVQGTLGHPVHS